MTPKKPVVLCILDGWGINPHREGNAVALARTPNFDRVMATCPHATLITFGPDVGLPTGQMGNSEVGHTNIGAGRVVAMDLGQIDLAVEDGSFAQNPALLEFIARLQTSKGTAHLMGVVSDGGVHGHITHLKAAVRALTGGGCARGDPRDHRRARCGAFIGRRFHRRPGGRSARGCARRHGDRALLRDGPRFALGAGGKSL